MTKKTTASPLACPDCHSSTAWRMNWVIEGKANEPWVGWLLRDGHWYLTDGTAPTSRDQIIEVNFECTSCDHAVGDGAHDLDEDGLYDQLMYVTSYEDKAAGVLIQGLSN